MFELLEKYLMNPLVKFSQKKFVRAVQAAGIAAMPFTIVGSMFLVLHVLPRVIKPLQGFYDNYLVQFADIYLLAITASIALLALYFLCVIGYEYTRLVAEEEEINLSPISGMLLSVFGFFITLPQFAKDGSLKLLTDLDNGIINGWSIGDAPNRLGSTGVFTAIVVSYVAVNVYRFCVKKNIVIKLPDSIPTGIANSFTALIPSFFVAVLMILVNGILIGLGTDVFDIISKPFSFVTGLTTSWIGTMIIMFLISAVWLVGIHANVIGAFLTPIVLYNMEMNIKGANIPFAGGFDNAYMFIGGAGGTLGLVLLMVIFAKSEQFKILGRAALIPGIFNINEPIIFGLPIVYNPFFAVPFILSPMATGTIAYFAVKLGIVKPMIAQFAWPIPGGFNAFIGTGGDWKAFVLAIITFAVSTMIYFPFFKKRDTELYNEQLEIERQKSEN